MAAFIHITDAKNGGLIVKHGIRAARRGVFSVPITRDFAVICIQFRIPDDEIVSVGKYNGEKISMTAGEAISTAKDHTAAMGLEVILARRVLPKEIVRIYPAPRIAGWR